MSISEQFKHISIAIFFLVSSFCIYNLNNFLQHKITSLEKEVIATRNISLNEIKLLRKDTFNYLIDTTNKIDNHVSFIETNTFSEINSLRKETFNSIDVIESDIMSRIDNMQSTVDIIANDYSTIPKNINNLYQRFDLQTDCDVNDLCWQNMTSDLLIDTRNVMRDGSVTFRTVNSSVPQITQDVSLMTNTISNSTPIITKNISEITENVNEMTRPKWYQKVLSYGLGTLGIVIAAK